MGLMVTSAWSANAILGVLRLNDVPVPRFRPIEPHLLLADATGPLVGAQHLLWLAARRPFPPLRPPVPGRNVRWRL